MSKKLIETIRERLIRLAKTGHIRSQVLLKVFDMGVLPKASLLDVYMQNANFFFPSYATSDDGKRYVSHSIWDMLASLAGNKPAVICGDINGKHTIRLNQKDAAEQIGKWIRQRHTKSHATRLAERRKKAASKRWSEKLVSFHRAKENSRPTDMLVCPFIRFKS